MASASHLFRIATTALCAGAAAAAVLLTQTPRAEACGCFAPPDPSVPIVQAGERILFAMADGRVTAHIQVQYSGPASEFGWLLPMPSVPEISIGTDELFTQVINTTQPLYRLDREYRGDCWFDPSRQGGSGGDSASSAGENDESPGDPNNPLVVQDSVGPFDYAILRADSKDAMFGWLSDNGFFVPAGTDDVVDPYIRPNAYFVALRLRKGNDVGDIQPIVVDYASDLPMIPIILTSVAADPDMPVQVWVLGDARAIPRNFFHTKINDARLNWLDGAQNYIEVITDSVDESDGHHAFITEYAGTSTVMRDVLDPPGRFGSLTELRAIGSAQPYIEFLNRNGYQIAGSGGQPPFFSPQYGTQMLTILARHLPPPAALIESGVTPSEYYTNISYYLGTDRFARPQLYADLDLTFDADALTDELAERIIDPTKDAGRLFRLHDYLTRLFTTMSPEEMTQDPVFSFNPELPEVSNVHSGRLIYFCGLSGNDDPATTPARLITEDGWELDYPEGVGDTTNERWAAVDMPESRFQEVVREEGPEDAVLDNTDLIRAAIEAENGRGGCSAGGGSGMLAAFLFLAALGLTLVLRRRGVRRSAPGGVRGSSPETEV